jgi:hypothetical protein
MLIVLKVGRVGPLCTDSPGDVIDLPEAEAQRLIDSNQADRFVETQMVAPVETAALPIPKLKRPQRHERRG